MRAGVGKRQTFSPNGTLLLIISLLAVHFCHSFFAMGKYRDLDFVLAMPFRMYGLTFLTSLFIHSSWSHVLINSFAIYMFGIHVEHRLGVLGMFVVFVISGICGHLAFMLIHSPSSLRSLGASGGAFGLLAFYALSWPRDRLKSMTKRLRIPTSEHGLLFKMGLLRGQARKGPSAIQLFYIFAVMEFVGLGVQLAGLTKINSAAHLGGAVGGIGCYWLLKGRTFRRKSKNA